MNLNGPADELDPRAAPGGTGLPAPPNRRRKVAAIAAGAVALIGLTGFFMVQGSTAEQRQQEMSDDLAAWEDAPLATVPPEVAAAVTFPSNQPRDRAKLCTALKVAYDEEHTTPEVDENEEDWNEFRTWTANRQTWRTAMDEMIPAGPVDGVPAITEYRDVRARYYRILTQASDPELRALADGIELNEIEGYQDDVEDAREDMYAHVVPHCGEPGA